METLLFEGEIEIASSEYVFTTYDKETDRFVESPIAGLDDKVSSLTHIKFTLDYPFEKTYQGELITESGPTLRQVIDAIRDGFAAMYEGTTQEAIPNMINMRVAGPYGRAIHAIEDLVIEFITLDSETAQLEIGIGS